MALDDKLTDSEIFWQIHGAQTPIGHNEARYWDCLLTDLKNNSRYSTKQELIEVYNRQLKAYYN